MDEKGRVRTVLNRAIMGCGAVSALLFGRMFFFDATAFAQVFPQAGPQWSMPDFLFSGYDTVYLQNLRNALENAPEAAQAMRSMHLGADLLFPLVFGLFLGLLIVRYMTGAVLFGRVMTRRHVLVLLVLPLGYGISDYAENITSLLYFQPSQPSVTLQHQLSSVLPWCTGLKFMFITVIAIILLRPFLFHRFISKSGY